MTFAAPRAIVRFLAACVLSYAAECATDKPIAELAGTIDDCCWRASRHNVLRQGRAGRPSNAPASRAVSFVYPSAYWYRGKRSPATFIKHPR